ncbi:polyphosphate kinase 1, partial [Escherichia coli]|nr:polyphosphate kinase 1 [Escherichia coli]
ADINKVFNDIRKPTEDPILALKNCKTLLVCHHYMRAKIEELIDREIAEAKAGRKAKIIIKVNSLSDKGLIKKLYQAAEAGVKIQA